MADVADQPARSRPPVLVFIHIPKTAGTTLTSLLRLNQPGTRTGRVSNLFKGGGGTQPGLMKRLSRSPSSVAPRGTRVLTGHVPLGIREVLPSDRNARYFTFLRDPVDRTISHYFGVLERHGGVDKEKKFGLPVLSEDAKLDDLLEGGYLQDNLQTRMLCGEVEPLGEVTEEMLEQAKRNLSDGLDFFGLAERFDESLVLARLRVGLRCLLYRSSDRVNTGRPRGDAIPSELRDAATRCNAYDIELYRHGVELFEATPELSELDFQVTVAGLRAAKAEGEIDLEVQAPAGFSADEEIWRMLLKARASAERLEWKIAQGGVRAEASRSRARRYKEKLARLEGAPARMKALEREVERLRNATGERPKRARTGPKRAARSGTKARARAKRDGG